MQALTDAIQAQRDLIMKHHDLLKEAMEANEAINTDYLQHATQFNPALTRAQRQHHLALATNNMAQMTQLVVIAERLRDYHLTVPDAIKTQATRTPLKKQRPVRK